MKELLTALLERVLAHEVSFVPGVAFDPDNERRNTMRLNFSNARPEQIVTGIERLGRVLTEVLEPVVA
jgi:2-aminoadipate transaminase